MVAENHEPGSRKARTPTWPGPLQRAAASPPARQLPRLSDFPAGPNPRLSRAGPSSVVPDSRHLGPRQREFQGAESHGSDLEWTPVSVVAQSVVIPPSSGSPAPPFILNDVHPSHYLATTDWSGYVRHQPSPGSPSLNSLRTGRFQTSGAVTPPATVTKNDSGGHSRPARGEPPWARRGGPHRFLPPLPEAVLLPPRAL